MSKSRIDWDEYWAKSQKEHEITIKTNENAKLKHLKAHYEGKTAKTAESTVKTANPSVNEIINAELARRATLYPPKQATDSVLNPNEAFRRSKLNKRLIYKDLAAKERGASLWPDDL
jgi:hypothetical protein